MHAQGNGRFAATLPNPAGTTVSLRATGTDRAGDTITIDVPEDHPALPPSLPVRITSISGDETGNTIKIGGILG